MKAAATLMILAFAAPALADEVVLNNGATFSGVVREERDRVIVELDFGTMTFKRSEVRSVRKTDDPIREFEQRLKGVTDAKGYYELALWAREKGLSTRAADLLRRVIFLEPDHEGARKALGYEKVEGRWLEGDELKVAQGYVKHNGRWLKKDTAEKFHEQDKVHQMEAERLASAERIAKLEAEVERARIALQRERLEVERERSSYSPWGLPWVVIGGTGRGGAPGAPCGGCGLAPCKCAAPRPATTQLPPLPQRLPPRPPLPAPITGR